MRRKLFLYLLNKYSNTEKDRIEVLKVLHSKVEDEYSEQTSYGNLYNGYIEFIISHWLPAWVILNDSRYVDAIQMLRTGMLNAFEDGIEIVKRKNKKMHDGF